MTHEEYKQQLTAWAGLTEKRLASLCDEYLPQQSELGQAARYSLLGGGKRVRAVLTLAACTPKFYPPQIATPESYVYGAGFSSDTTGVGERWWELFGDTTLDALVEQALANNRDVAVAAARVQQARANLKTVRAQYLPQIGAEATAEGEYTPETKIVQSYAVEPTL